MKNKKIIKEIFAFLITGSIFLIGTSVLILAIVWWIALLTNFFPRF